MLTKKTFFYSSLACIAALVFLAACKKKEENNALPLVETVGASNITYNSATLAMALRQAGSADVTEAGICIDDIPEPTVSASLKIQMRTSLGGEKTTVNTLSGGKSYYFRAYAINKFGTVYGEVLSFKTLSSWSLLSSPSLVLQNSGPMVASANAVFIHDGPNRVFKSTDNGLTWQAFNAGLTGMTLLGNMAIQQGSLIVVEGNGNAYASGLETNSWTKIAPAFGNGSTYNVGDIVIDNGKLFVCMINGPVTRIALAPGSFWNFTSNQFTSGTNGSMVIKNNNLFVSINGGVMVSTNNGGTWYRPDNGINFDNIGGLIFRGDELIAGSYGKVFYSNDYANSFSTSVNGTESQNFIKFSSDNTYLFAQTSSGYFKSDNTGRVWSDFTVGLPVKPTTYKLALVNGYAFVCFTEGTSIYRIYRRSY